MASAGENLPPVSVEFSSEEWGQEVGRLSPNSLGRAQAERARREIEAGQTKLAWKRCEAEGRDGTRLPGCRKLYIPLDGEGASAAPFGFVFQLAQKPDGALVWNFIAFGERHPQDRRTRSVYERAHKRLHGRYP
jgi:hypothetical protein